MAERQEPFESSQQSGTDASPGRDRSSGFLAGIVCGALVGAGLALLFAPERGDAIRRRLRRRLSRLGDDAREGMDDVASRARREIFRRRRLREGLESGARKAKLSLRDAP